MARSRPPSALLTTYGIVALVAGCLFLVCGVCSATWTTTSKVEVNGRDVTPIYNEYMSREVPIYMVEQVADVVLALVVAFGFIAAGALLLWQPKWGQVLALLVAFLSMIHQLMGAIWEIAWIGPARAAFWRSQPFFDLSFFSRVKTTSVVAWAVLVILVDLAVIIGMALPSTWQMLWGKPKESRDQEEEEDDDFERRARRRSRSEDDDRYEED